MIENSSSQEHGALVDGFGRRIDYLRVSVTDRCNFRCSYCMAEQMTFLPRKELLTLGELDRVCTAFIRRGVRKLRITGGEPLVRRSIMELFGRLSRHLENGGLDELTLTTNGSRLGHFAESLAACGVRRINVSIDSLNPRLFKTITRGGDLDTVLQGITKAESAGMSVKINTVALKGVNEHEIEDFIRFAHSRGRDLTLIEVMPMGEIEENRVDQYLPLSELRLRLARRFSLEDIAHRTGGPARYVRVAETGGRLGFITPLTHNFCETCNRVRLTCTGKLYMCLGQEDAADLRAPLRESKEDAALDVAIGAAIARKPKGHDFLIDRRDARASVPRHMSATGG